MINSIFVNDYSKTLDKFNYSNKFVKYLLLNFLYENEDASYKNVVDFLNDYYNGVIDPKKVFDYLIENYVYSVDVFNLTKNQKDEYTRLKRIEHVFYSLEIKGEKFIEDELVNNLNMVNKDLDYLLSITYSLINSELQLQDDYVSMIFYDVISNKNKYIDIIDYLMYKDEEIIEAEISDYLLSNKLKLILSNKKIYMVKDLVSFSNEVILALFSHNIDKILANIFYHKNTHYLCDFGKKINDAFDLSFRDDKIKDIVYKRCGICCESMTLEAVAKEYDLTRERIRQIVVKNVDKIKNNVKKFKEEVILLFNVMVGLNKNYLTKEQILNYIKDKYAVDKLCFMCGEFDFPIYFDSTYKVLYNPNEYSVSEIVSDVELRIGSAIGIETINDYDSFEKAVIKNNYRLSANEQIYVKKGINIAEIAVEIVDELFPNGYKFGSDDDFEAVNAAFKNKYHINLSKSELTDLLSDGDVTVKIELK